MHPSTIKKLNNISNDINKLYGYVDMPGDNFGEPAINSGPCAPFAKAFYDCWNKRFKNKVNIVFIMVKNSDECWHVLIRLPNNMLYDGGHGVHNEDKYSEFEIVDMQNYDQELLEKRAYGLDREYPRYCPNLSLSKVTSVIEAHLSEITDDI
jgi:hypothetical protein